MSNIQDKLLPICEVFGPTIQGEGPRAGRLSIFVRTALCNLSCQGFGCEYSVNGEQRKGCDTFYSVDPAFSSEWKYYNSTELTELVNELNNTNCDIVVTGGEPTLHWQNKEMQTFLKNMLDQGRYITIETNASHSIDIEPWQTAIHFSMSVKMNCSGEPKEKRINIDNINKIIRLTDSWFKFVVRDLQDVEEIRELLTKCYQADVFLMPLGENKQHLEENMQFTVQTAIQNKWNYSPRLHIDLWGSERGK